MGVKSRKVNLVLLMILMIGPPFLSPFVLSASITLQKISALPLDTSEEVDRVVLKDNGLYRIVQYKNLLSFLNRYEVVDPEGSRVISKEVIMRVLIVSAMKSENVTKLIMAVDLENLRKIVMIAIDIEGELSTHLSTFDGILSFLSTIEKNELYRTVVLFRPEVSSVFDQIKNMFTAFYTDLAGWVKDIRQIKTVLFEIASEIQKIQSNQSADLELLYNRLASIDYIDKFYDMIIKKKLLSSTRYYIESTITRPFDQLNQMLSLAPENVKKAAEQLMSAISSPILSGVGSLIDYLESGMFSKLLISSEELSERLLRAKSDLAVIREVADKKIEEMKHPINLSNNARQLFFIYAFLMLFVAIMTCIGIYDLIKYEKRNKRRFALKVLLSLVICTPLIFSLIIVNKNLWRFIEMNNSTYFKPFPTPNVPLSGSSFFSSLILLVYYIMLPMYSYVYPLSFNDVFLITPIPLPQYITFIQYCAWLLIVYAILKLAFLDGYDFAISLVTILISYVVAGVIGGIIAYIISPFAPEVVPFLISFSVITYSLYGIINRLSFFLLGIASLVSFSTLLISFAPIFILYESSVLSIPFAGLSLFGGAGTAYLLAYLFVSAWSHSQRLGERLFTFAIVFFYVLLVLVAFSYAWGFVATYGPSSWQTIGVSCFIATLLFGFHAGIATFIWRISEKICNFIYK
jgi:hypothetical protein